MSAWGNTSNWGTPEEDRADKALMKAVWNEQEIVRIKESIRELRVMHNLMGSQQQQLREALEEACQNMTSLADKVKEWRALDLTTHGQCMETVNKFNDELENACCALQAMGVLVMKHEERLTSSSESSE